MSDDETEKDSKKLPPRVERALSRAREAVKKDAQQKQGRWLALVPVTIAILMFLLTMPRATEPEDIPTPAVDQRALDGVVAADRARAAAARQTRLPNDVLTVGTAIRALNKALVDKDQEAYLKARTDVDASVRAVNDRPDGPADLMALRAVQTEEFLSELTQFEQSGKVSPALDELAGPFLPHLRDAKWVDGNRLLLDDDERRVMYKLVWNTLTAAHLELTLDETRVLYRFYLAHPHPPDNQLTTLEVERGAAKSPAECERYNANARRATELWRADKIRALGALDPAYPAAYALGVALYRAGRYESAIDAFRSWIDTHPDGKWSARARNHLKGSLAAYGAI